MSKFLKVLIVLLGYVAAVGLGLLAGWLNDLRMPASVQSTSPGMVAEGDSILFFVVTGLGMIVPTALALFFLRSSARFWSLYSWAMLALALTGPPLQIMGGIFHSQQVKDSPWALLSFLVVVRIFSIPFLAPADLVSALIAPDSKNRRRLLLAMAIEITLGLFVAFNIFFRNRFM